MKVSEQVLYQARIALPSSVPTGQLYGGDLRRCRNGRVVASATSRVEVRKIGLRRRDCAQFADRQAFFYGLLAVAMSVLMGWIAGRLFALV